jgi:hypothetical protein
MPDQEREPTPEQEAEVTRLLAEARVAEPLPAHIAARLDRVLEGLAEERAGGPPVAAGHVVALAGRRRRATWLLAAAAAVVAVGIGVGQVVGGSTSGTDDSSAGGGNADAQVQDRDSSGSDSGSDSPGVASEPVPPPKENDDGASSFDEHAAPRVATAGWVHKSSFTADANQLRRAIPDDAVDGEFVQLAADQLPAGYVRGTRDFACAPTSWGPGVLVPVFFDGNPAVLAYRPATGESQVVDLVQCGTGNILGSTTLQAG